MSQPSLTPITSGPLGDTDTIVASRTAAKQRPPKLRSSCDECAVAKVRCSKERPKCARCVTGGVTCVYGLSRKVGKVRKRPQVEALGLEPPDQRMQSDTEENTAASSSSISQQWEDLLQNTGNDGMLHTNWLGNGVSNVSSSSRWSHHDTPSHSLNPSLRMARHPSISILQDETLGGDSMSYQFNDCFPMFPSFNRFSDTPRLGDTDAVMSIENLPAHSLSATSDSSEREIHEFGEPAASNCYELAYSTLASLHMDSEKFKPSQLSLTRGKIPTQTLDNVLSQNKEAMNAVNRLLSCSCSREPHLAMLYVCIISKILFWYQVAAGCKSSSSWGTRTASPSTTTTPSSCASTPAITTISFNTVNEGHMCLLSERPAHSPGFWSIESAVAPTQITVGSFSLDEKDQESFTKFLFLTELRKLDHLIDIFLNLGASKDAVGVDGAFGNLYASSGGWLKGELARSIQAVKAGIEAADDI